MKLAVPEKNAPNIKAGWGFKDTLMKIIQRSGLKNKQMNNKTENMKNNIL